MKRMNALRGSLSAVILKASESVVKSRSLNCRPKENQSKQQLLPSFLFFHPQLAKATICQHREDKRLSVRLLF
jgi:hypothetical protein